jgi:hypothetical protein
MTDPPRDSFQETAESLSRTRDRLKQVSVTLQAMLATDRRFQGYSVPSRDGTKSDRTGPTRSTPYP